MKKLFILSMMLLSLTLVGCSQNQLSQDELFDKKQECTSYLSNAKQREAQFLIEEKDWHQYSNITTIFYSQKMNSCLYAGDSTQRLQKDISFSFFIKDALTYEDIYSTKIKGEFENKIKELKGE